MKKLMSAPMSRTARTTNMMFRRSTATCAATALVLLQGCAAAYVPVEPPAPRPVPVVYQPVIVQRPVVQTTTIQTTTQPAPQPAVVVQQQVAPPSVVVAQQPVAIYTAQQLDQISGPIALYPDPLIAQILPASTYPLEIVRAARLQRSGVVPEVIDQQDLDPSVKAIAHYPTVLAYMDTNLEWTQQLGQAFMAQPNDVMQSIQRLRQQAANLGNLVTTTQQQVVYEEQYIRVIPVAPEIIYVPVYQPQVVYYQPCGYTPFVTFGIGFGLGSWLDLDCDWGHHGVYRQGWAWNRWHDNVHIEHDRITRFHRPEHREDDHRSYAWQHQSDRDNRRDSRRGAPSNDRHQSPNFQNQPPHNRSGEGSRRAGGSSLVEGDRSGVRPDVLGDGDITPPALRTPTKPSAVVDRPGATTPAPRSPSTEQLRPISPASQTPVSPPAKTLNPSRPGGVPSPAPASPTPQRPDAPVPSRPAAATPPAPVRPSAPPAATPTAPSQAAPASPVRPGGSPAPSSPAPRPVAPAPSAPAPAPTRPGGAGPAPVQPAPAPAPVPAPAPAPRPQSPAAPPAAGPSSPSPTPSQPDTPRRPR